MYNVRDLHLHYFQAVKGLWSYIELRVNGMGRENEKQGKVWKGKRRE